MAKDDIVEQIVGVFERRGSSQYGGEAVSQLEHALQAATLAEEAAAAPALITAALLHDIGHLLHDLRPDAPTFGVDDTHEELGYAWLQEHFGPDVTEPVRLHVRAKQYLCAAEPGYRESLSAPSEKSLMIQGGPLEDDELVAFREHPYFNDAVCLRRWDDLAKIPGKATPTIDHFVPNVRETQLVRC